MFEVRRQRGWGPSRGGKELITWQGDLGQEQIMEGAVPHAFSLCSAILHFLIELTVSSVIPQHMC